jgi:uncharacterized membrane protein
MPARSGNASSGARPAPPGHRTRVSWRDHKQAGPMEAEPNIAPAGVLSQHAAIAGRVFLGATSANRSRVQAVDIVRGLVIVIMALDHTRDFAHAAAMAFQPENLAQSTPAIFLTRWITHFCAPFFMFSAGIGAFLRLERGGTRSELSRFLWTRGLWLVVLEFTVVRAGFFLDVALDPLFLLVFWPSG